MSVLWGARDSERQRVRESEIERARESEIEVERDRRARVALKTQASTEHP